MNVLPAFSYSEAPKKQTFSLLTLPGEVKTAVRAVAAELLSKCFGSCLPRQAAESEAKVGLDKVEPLSGPTLALKTPDQLKDIEALGSSILAVTSTIREDLTSIPKDAEQKVLKKSGQTISWSEDEWKRVKSSSQHVDLESSADAKTKVRVLAVNTLKDLGKVLEKNLKQLSEWDAGATLMLSINISGFVSPTERETVVRGAQSAHWTWTECCESGRVWTAERKPT